MTGHSFILYKGKIPVLEIDISYTLYDIRVNAVNILGGDLPEIEMLPTNIEKWLKSRIKPSKNIEKDLERIRKVLLVDENTYVNQAMLPAVCLIEGFVGDDDYILKPKGAEILLFTDDNKDFKNIIKIENDLLNIEN